MKAISRISRKLFFIPTIITAFCLGAPSAALAGTDIWTGGGGDDIFWRTADNWLAGTIPLAGDNLVFSNTASLVSSNNFTTGTFFGSITFATPAGAFVLKGHSVATTNITDLQVVTPETITLPIIATNNLLTVDVVGNSILNLNGEIQQPLATTAGVTVTGNGLVNLNYNATNQTTNIFGGTLEVDDAIIAPASDLSLGTTNDLNTPQAGRLVLNGGTLEATGNLALNANRGISLGKASGNSWGTLAVDSGVTLSYGGVMADNGGASGLTKAGFGQLTLFGSNSYTGPTTNLLGQITLDFSQAAVSDNIIDSSSSLVLGGATAPSGNQSY
ncbi:MAG TPA: hypothetical protein VN516_07135, partial [Candidatus Baltobacteraceae bacterium]|nr:hypothetical protein [Candidatus Baltobacteraceae bacterium]